MIQQISSGSFWEDMVGYSRAVKAGNIIEVAGTTAMDGETLVGEGDLYAQTKFIFQKIEKALQQLGGSLNDVVRTRMFVTDINNWQLAGNAHREVFVATKPAATMVQVQRLIDVRLLIEIEVTAVIL